MRVHASPSSCARQTVRIVVDLLTGLQIGVLHAYSPGLETAALGVMKMPAARWNGFHPYRLVRRESTRYAHAIDE